MREINIRPALNGWVCQVGCQTIVFEEKTKMLVEIGKYIDDPSGVEKAYRKASPNKTMEMPIEVPRATNMVARESTAEWREPRPQCEPPVGSTTG